ncbi:MAG: shikimate dehydrogenase [Opitutales bacterium]|nr:shikimate dehydrogenase [Opitutales bacterium]
MSGTESAAEERAPGADGPLTPDALGAWDFGGTAVAVLGHPIHHSLSPPMHNAALKAMAAEEPRFAGWKYFAFDVPPQSLAGVLPLFAQRGFRGINLTIPHKVDVVPLLGEVDSAAARMGAVNTLILREQGGGYAGANTDGYGISRAVTEAFGRSLHGARVVLLGAGGAARAIAAQCLDEGCAQLWVGNRNEARLDALLDLVRGLYPEAAGRVHGFSLDEPPVMAGGAVVINATALGLRADDPPPLDPRAFAADTVVYDTTYGTVNGLARACAAAGVPYADGLGMLVWQGARSLAMWTGGEPPVDVMTLAARAALEERSRP